MSAIVDAIRYRIEELRARVPKILPLAGEKGLISGIMSGQLLQNRPDALKTVRDLRERLTKEITSRIGRPIIGEASPCGQSVGPLRRALTEVVEKPVERQEEKSKLLRK